MDTCFFVLIPVYNAEAFLDECFQSVLSQTDQNFQIVAVDDGSPDGSGAICDRYAAEDPRIHVIHQKNQGALSARVAGVSYIQKIAREDDFIVCLDSDDTLLPMTLETLRRAVEKDQADLIFYRMQLVRNGVNLGCPESETLPIGPMPDKGAFYKTVFYGGRYNGLPNKAAAVRLFSRSDYREYYHIHLAEDLLQSISLYENCRMPVFLPDILYCYNVNPGSVTNSHSVARFSCDSTVYRLVSDFLEKQPMLTQEDLDAYDDHIRYILEEITFDAMKLSGTFGTRREILKKLAADPLYHRLLSDPGKGRSFLWMLKHKMFFPLCLIGSVCRLLGALRRKLRG